MRSIIRGAIVLVACVSGSASASAQSPRDVIDGKVRPGDKLTITTREAREIKGRFLSGGDDIIVLAIEGGEERLRWSDVDRVKRRRNGVRLGAIIGAGAGVATGIPVAMLAENEHGEGAKALTSMILLGLGAGIGVDALLSTNRTVYDRRSYTRLDVLPQRGGGSLRVTLAWQPPQPPSSRSLHDGSVIATRDNPAAHAGSGGRPRVTVEWAPGSSAPSGISGER